MSNGDTTTNSDQCRNLPLLMLVVGIVLGMLLGMSLLAPECPQCPLCPSCPECPQSASGVCDGEPGTGGPEPDPSIGEVVGLAYREQDGSPGPGGDPLLAPPVEVSLWWDWIPDDGPDFKPGIDVQVSDAVLDAPPNPAYVGPGGPWNYRFGVKHPEFVRAFEPHLAGLVPPPPPLPPGSTQVPDPCFYVRVTEVGANPELLVDIEDSSGNPNNPSNPLCPQFGLPGMVPPAHNDVVKMEAP